MLFALPFAAVGVGAFAWAAWTVLAWHEIAGWTPVSAEVVSAALEEHDGDDSTDLRGDSDLSLPVRRAGLHEHPRRDRLRRRQHRHLSTTPLRTTACRTRIPHTRNGVRRSRESRRRRAQSRAALGHAHAERRVRTRVRRRRLRLAVRRARCRQEARRRGGSTRAIPRRALALAPRMGERTHRGHRTHGRVRRDRLRSALESHLAAGVDLRARRDRERQHARCRRFAVPARGSRPRSVGDPRVAAAQAFQGGDVDAATRARRARRSAQGLDSRRGRGPGHGRLPPRARVLRGTHARQRQESPDDRAHAVAEAMARAAASVPDQLAVHVDSRRRRRARRSTGHLDGRRRRQDPWRLEVAGECPGPDFSSRFELPVFDTGEAQAADRAPVRRAPRLSTSERPDTRTLDILGIAYERRADGAETWTFRRGHHKTLAATISLFAAVWTIASRRAIHDRRTRPDPDRVLVVRRDLPLVGAVALVHRAPRDARPRRLDARTPRLHGARARRDSRAMDPLRQRQARHAGRQQALLRPKNRNQRGHAYGRELAGRLRRRELARAALEGGRSARLRRNASGPHTSRGETILAATGTSRSGRTRALARRPDSTTPSANSRRRARGRGE